ncbi:hypothetical protein FACS1894181_18040 [Bacteroidia bacterium]|nr:hypothetical protein FACS1894181_18040 [Bacteroidia bacterium]
MLGGHHSTTMPESGSLTLEISPKGGVAETPNWDPPGCTGPLTVYAFSFTATCSGTYTVLYAGTNTFITVNPDVTREVTFNPDNGSPS